MGYDGYSSSKDGATSKQVSQSDTEGDPLVNINFIMHSLYIIEHGLESAQEQQGETWAIFRKGKIGSFGVGYLIITGIRVNVTFTKQQT